MRSALLDRQARVDRLTGAATRRAFEERLHAGFTACRDEARTLALVVGDLDHFKRINDTYGHAAGDRALVAAARVLLGPSRGRELCARWGGEEFVLLLEDTPGEAALEIAERLRRRIEDTELDEGGERVPLSMSFGVACFPELAVRGGDELLAVADGALYAAKRLGRNLALLDLGRGRLRTGSGRLIESDENARVWAIPAPGGGNRAFCDRMNGWAQGEGQPGLGYVFWRDGEEGGAGPIAKNLGPERTELIRAFDRARLPDGLLPEVADPYFALRPDGLRPGDAVFFVAGVPATMAKFAALARQRIAEELELIAKNCYRFCWVVDFPMYEWDEQEKRVTFSHNPFSMPQGGLEALEARDPLEILAYQYDIVCNGVELSSGAIRNHRPDIMVKAFALAGYGRDVLEARFGGMFRALHYGAPPHGGLAPGIDRIVMLIANQPNLREVTAFPLNQQAEELLLGAPSPVDDKQLKELHLQLSLAARERLREDQARAGPAATADHLVSPHAR